MSAAVEKGFVPLSAIEGEQLGRIAVGLNLPDFVDTDKIGINLPRIETMCNLSGIEAVAIVGIKGQDTSKEVPVVAGINKDGSAIAGKGVEKTTVPASSHIQAVLPIHRDMGKRTTGLIIGVNVDELSQNASQSNEGSRDTAVWARSLDSAIKIPLRKAGTENLISHWDEEAKFAYLFAPGFMWLIDALTASNTNPEMYLAQLVQVSLVWRGLDYIQQRKDPHYRHSLFVDPQFDRALALQVKGRTQKLVADLHPDKK